MKQLYRFVNYFGFLEGVKLFLKVRSNRLESLQLPGYARPFRLRRGTTDLAMFYQIFFNQCYDINITFTPKLIIDAGANIGLASIYFANRFPQAKIVAIEPQDDNFSLMRENVQGYNVVPSHNALWSVPVAMLVNDKGYGESGYMTEPSQTAEGLKSVTLGEIMRREQAHEIDILKIDIEGAEAEVFSENYELWLPATRCLIIEIHDNMKPGCSKAVFKAISTYNFELQLRGENLVFLNRDLL